MHIRIITGVMLMFLFMLPVIAQESDSIRTVSLEQVTVVAESFQASAIRGSALSVEVAAKEFLDEHFTGNLIQALEYLPGVRSMDIGSGFSKPMIRGLGFNRIAVAENGIKQEGQQWGSDHGLEMDAFGIDRVVVRKGPSSLLYGSDAMGGVIEILQTPTPVDNQFSGEVTWLGKSVNNTLGGSLMLGFKKNDWYARLRYSEQRYGDYRVPADTMVYLTQRVPIYNRRLKNTAGYERNAGLYTEYRHGAYYSSYSLSNVYQKTGFFPGAHGIPSINRVQDDGDSRNIDLPCNTVNHFKVTTRQQYVLGEWRAVWDLGYQNNHREEWSEFHTHYDEQPVPANHPDKELEFRLQTFTSSIKAHWYPFSSWEYSFGWDIQYQHNRIGGYSFLLPDYERFTSGAFALAMWKASDRVKISGGLRYDYGKLNSEAYADPYLETYLINKGYEEQQIASYRWRSYPVNRNFGDFSGSAGVVWIPRNKHTLKLNMGYSFRLPGANELASNGVHHGTFRHEQGDPTLDSERGWQLDASWLWQGERVTVTVSPFVSWFDNYIYLQPTGEWSILPHAGQIYRYTGAEALFAGTETTVEARLTRWLSYSFSGEYVYTRNLDEQIPLSFSPPASMRNTISGQGKRFEVYAELHTIARQKEVARNESPTAGTNLVNLGARFNLLIGRQGINVSLSVRNLLDTKYYNHLSFYRKVEIPEPGRNLQLIIKVPFKTNLK